MTICRKCGKEIPDGEDLCEDCKSLESNSGESYLDELMKSMGISEDASEKPELEKESVMEEELDVPEFVLDDLLTQEEDVPAEDVPELVLNETPEEVEPQVEEEIPELDLGGISVEDLPPEDMEIPDLDLGGIGIEDLPVSEEEIPELDLGGIVEEDIPAVDIPSMEEEPVTDALDESVMEIPDVPGEPVSAESEEDEINSLLEMLAKDYSEEPQTESELEQPEGDVPMEPVTQDISAPEVSLFSDNESDDIFADSANESTTSMEDIFQDALSAVDYSEKSDETEQEEETMDDVFALEGDFEPEGEDESEEESEPSEEPSAVPLAEPVKKKEEKQKKEKKDSFWKRIFGNVVTDQTAEEEAKEREKEKEEEEARAAEKEEKEKQAAADKEAKEKKAAAKAEQAAAKAAAREEKKKKKAELAAVEVVGKINPVGAAIVMIFFGIICVTVIFGTRTVSYRSSLSNARTQFEKRDYEGAYESLSGISISEASQELADKIRLCMKLQKQLNSYTNYYEMKMYLEALDSLVKGIRNYDAGMNKADEFEILTQYNELESKITSILFSEFGVSETEAREINSSRSQEEYTAKLEEIIARWEAKNAEDER